MRNVLCAVVVGLAVQACAEEKASVFLDSSVGSSGASKDGGAAGKDSGAPSAMAPTKDAGAKASGKIDRSSLSSTGTAPLDYENPALWACLPGNDPNECHTDLTATEILKDGTHAEVPHTVAEEPTFDCFYIYPTVATQGGGNMMDFSNIAPVLDPLRSQGARFSRLCEVYAPLYRQVSLTNSSSDAGGIQTQGDPRLAVGDVLAAFDEYLSKWNKGRNFVVVGHSQGTSMATQLLQQRIDNDPEVREKLISAVLLGGQIRTPPGEKKGGSFANIPTCSEPGETGCVIAYVSYAKEAPPTPGKAIFGGQTDAGVVACTEPAALANNAENYKGSYFAKKVSNPAFASPGFFPTEIETPYMLYRDFFKGTCINRGGYSYLEIEVAKTEDDTRENPPYRNPTLESTGWGLHLMDYNLELEDILEAVRLQAEAKQ